MNDPHDTILEEHFWTHVDRGQAPESTPLFTKIHEGQPLADRIQQVFRLSAHEAQAAIKLAQKEVEL